MKIIEGKNAPNARRLRIFLAEKGVEIPTEVIDLKELEHKSEAYRALNPMQRVPILVLDDGTVFAESVAICRYFDMLHPEPPLMGMGPWGQAMVEMWNRRVEFGLFFTVRDAFRHLHPGMVGREVPQVAEWGEANKPKAIEFLRMLDKELVTRDFIADGGYSIADITALVAVDFMKVAKVEMPEELVNVKAWYRRVSGRESASA